MRIYWALIFFVAFTTHAAPSREASEEDDVDVDERQLSAEIEEAPAAKPSLSHYLSASEENELHRKIFAEIEEAPAAKPSLSHYLSASEQNELHRKLSAEIAGKHTLKSTHGTYIRHVEDGTGGWKVDTARLCMACEQWTIVDREGKVALQPYCHAGNRGSPFAGFLRAYSDGSVRVERIDDQRDLWTPVKREDGSWSFKSHHGRYLSADRNTGAVYTVTDQIDEWENFWLGSWPEAATPSQSQSARRGEDSASNEKSRESNAMSLDQFLDLVKKLQGAFENTGKKPSKGRDDSSTRDAGPDSSVSEEKAADDKEEDEATDESEQKPRSLYAEIAGKRTLKSHYNAYLRAWSNHSDWFVGASPQPKECEQWYIEEHAGKVALKAYCSDKFLRSNEGRYVDLGDKPQAGELWTPVKNADGSWSFKGFHGTWLRAQPHGRLSLQSELYGGDEKFWLGEWTDKFDELEGARSLKSTHDTFLRASYCASDIDATNVDMAVHLKACEKWQIKLRGKKVSLMPIAEPGKYLRAYSDGSVGLSKKQEEVGERELWTPLKHADGSWSLKSAHGKLLSATTNGTVTTVTDNMAEENFWIKEIED